MQNFLGSAISCHFIRITLMKSLHLIAASFLRLAVWQIFWHIFHEKFCYLETLHKLYQSKIACTPMLSRFFLTFLINFYLKHSAKFYLLPAWTSSSLRHLNEGKKSNKLFIISNKWSTHGSRSSFWLNSTLLKRLYFLLWFKVLKVLYR